MDNNDRDSKNIFQKLGDLCVKHYDSLSTFESISKNAIFFLPGRFNEQELNAELCMYIPIFPYTLMIVPLCLSLFGCNLSLSCHLCYRVMYAMVHPIL